MARAQNLLTPLDDLAYLIECAALDYTGELKTELSRLCESIRNGGQGYEATIVQASLPDLEASLRAYRTDQKSQGASGLIRISRAWWAAAKSEAAA